MKSKNPKGERPLKKKLDWKSVLKSYALITLGSLVYAVSFTLFYAPIDMAFGGLTGVAQILNHFLPFLPVGTMVFVMNVPLFLLGWKLLGGHLLLGSLWAMATASGFIDLITYFFGSYLKALDPMISCIAGGVILGVSLGLVISQGATTGGTDLLARLLKLKFGWLPMGRLLLIIDITIIAGTGIAFGSLYSSLYGAIALYISTVVMDKMLYGMDTAKVAYIISTKPEAVTEALMRDLDRGVTLLEGTGGYSGDRRQVIMCAFKQRQIVRMKALVKEIDPAAFLIVCDAHEVLGDGFREYKQNDI